MAIQEKHGREANFVKVFHIICPEGMIHWNNKKIELRNFRFEKMFLVVLLDLTLILRNLKKKIQTPNFQLPGRQLEIYFDL